VASTFSRDQYQALHEAAGILLRKDRGRIVLRGEDRKDYLQGLLSNDILALGSGDWCYATLLTPQGRMISDMRVFDVGELVLMDLALAVTPQVTEHLEKFVITEDVTVEDVTSETGQVGVYGPQARGVLHRATSGSGVEPMFAVPSSDIGIDGVDVIVAAGQVEPLVASLSAAGAVVIDPSTAEATRIEAGLPRFLVDMDSTTIPLEAGIESSAISMTKGCYVGQEVIVRVLHRGGGRVAKKLAGFVIDGGRVRPEDRVYTGEREVGRITSVADSPKVGKQIALGYVQRDLTEPGTVLSIRTADGEAQAIVATVPFARH
jgi:folate-binding protein YgfZ